MKKKLLALALIVIAIPMVSQGQVMLNSWDFTNDGTTTLTKTSTFDATGMASSTIVRGAGMGNPTNRGQTSANWTDASILFAQNGWIGDLYLEWEISAESGYQFSLTSIESVSRGSVNFVPGKNLFAYSLDNGSSWSFLDVFTSSATNEPHELILSGTHLAALSNITSVLFRYAAASDSTADPLGHWGVGNRATGGSDTNYPYGLAFNGTVEAIPEPSTYAMLILAGVLGVWIVRRKKLRAEA